MDMIDIIGAEIGRVSGTSSTGIPLHVAEVEVGNHLCLVINDASSARQSRVLNCRQLLSTLSDLPDDLGPERVWEALLESDPQAPSDPAHFNVTYIAEDLPYLEWRWVGGTTVQRRAVPGVGNRPQESTWEQLKVAELYYHISRNSPLGQWLEEIGFNLPEADWERLKNFIPGPEQVIWTSTGPSTLVAGDEWDFPDMGWCHITRIERIPSATDGVNMSEMDEITKGWEEFVYYGYVIEPHAPGS